jgi:hypothetical protein
MVNQMSTTATNVEIAERFGIVAQRFCSVVDSALVKNRTELLVQVYPILPTLIGEAIRLPDVSLSDNDDETDEIRFPASAGVQQHAESLYTVMKEKLGEWDLYHQVFDPTQDNEAIFGTLADDIADIYFDMKKGLVFIEPGRGHQPKKAIFTWRVLFYSHWGNPAMDALRTIHFRLHNEGLEGYT